MADSMVTSMARAGFSEAWSRFPNDFGPSFDHDAELFEAMACVMIDKMFDPSEGMLAALGRSMMEQPGAAFGVHYRVMIGAALAPNPPADERDVGERT